MLFPEGLGKVSRNGIAPCSLGDSIVNFMLGSIEFKCASSVLRCPGTGLLHVHWEILL